MPSNVAYDSARVAARRALARDSLVGNARATAAFASMAIDWTFQAGERELHNAIAREPNSAESHLLYAVYLCTIGRTDEGLATARAGVVLDPLNVVSLWAREQCLYMGHRYDQLIAEHAQATALWPDPHFLYWDSYLAATYREKGQFDAALAEYALAQKTAGEMPLFGYAVTLARAGKRAESKAMLDRLLAYGRTHYINPITVAAVYTALGDRDQAFAWLDRTAMDRTGWLWGVDTWPEFESLKPDPRLAQLIKRIGLPTVPRVTR